MATIPLLLLLAGLPLLLLGYLRMSAFVINRVIFGHRDEKPYLQWTAMAVPPLLLLLSLSFIPLVMDLYRGDPLRTASEFGAGWYALSVVVAILWIVQRFRVRREGHLVDGTRIIVREILPLRRAHIRNPTLQALGLHNEVYDLDFVQYEVDVEHLPAAFDGYRIAFLTDLHVAGMMRRPLYRTCIEKINSSSVDLLLFGGDFVSFARDIPLMAELMTKDVRVRDGSYAVLGNHDYWADADGVVAALTSRGVRFVVNRNIAIRRGEEKIHLVGIDEVYRGRPDMVAAFADVPQDAARIGLSHHPDIIDLLGDRRLDLLLCGHTHGGQIRFPYFGPVIVPSVHEGDYASGFFRERRLLMYVSRGVGAIPPVRILCRPELPIFTLRRPRIDGRTTQ
jgi:uncharacterized protein